MNIHSLIKARPAVYSFCDNCCEQTYVDELEVETDVEDENVIGICNDCFNTVTVTRYDLEHAGKSF